MVAFKFRCHHCEEAIGVYEPVIVVAAGQARETSRAEDPDLETAPGECYHRACYGERFGPDAA